MTLTLTISKSLSLTLAELEADDRQFVTNTTKLYGILRRRSNPDVRPEREMTVSKILIYYM